VGDHGRRDFWRARRIVWWMRHSVVEIELARDQHDAGAQQHEAYAHEISIIVHSNHQPADRSENVGACTSFRTWTAHFRGQLNWGVVRPKD
jgi:hypothetical protein